MNQQVPAVEEQQLHKRDPGEDAKLALSVMRINGHCSCIEIHLLICVMFPICPKRLEATQSTPALCLLHRAPQ